MLIILVVIGVATHLFLTPSTIETSGSKNITEMINRTVEVLNEVNNVIATSPPMAIVLYMIAPEKLKAVNFQWMEDELMYVSVEIMVNVVKWCWNIHLMHQNLLLVKM